MPITQNISGKQKLKICYVNIQYQLGGAETVMHQLHNGMRGMGHSTRMCVALGKSYPRDGTVYPLYPRFLSRLEHSRFRAPIQYIFPRAKWTDRKFRSLSRSTDDIIHFHNLLGQYTKIESLAFLAAHKKVVWTFHHYWGITGGCVYPKECSKYQEYCGSCPHLGDFPLSDIDNTTEELRAKIRYLARIPFHIIAPSRLLAKKVQESKVGRGWKVHYIPNGVDVSRFGFQRKHLRAFRHSLGLDPDKITILNVNRNFKEPSKGFDMISTALSCPMPANIQMLLVGENSDWAAQQLPAHIPVCSLGYMNSITSLAEVYEATDILLFASPNEVFPCTVIEAMSAKCCIIATPTIGVVEQVANGKTGLLAESINGASLGRLLSDALSNPSRLAPLGEAARDRVLLEFSEESMIRKHLELYQFLIDQPRVDEESQCRTGKRSK